MYHLYYCQIRMQNILQLNFNGLISWIILTLSTVILLSVLYRFSTIKRNDNTDIQSQQSDEELPKKFMFISADVQQVLPLLKSASEDTKNNYFNKSIQKTNKAILIILSQLLKYFTIEDNNMNVEDMFNELQKNGVTLNTNIDNFRRFNEIIKKDIKNEQLSKEEAIWVLKFADFIIENSKEVIINEEIK